MFKMGIQSTGNKKVPALFDITFVGADTIGLFGTFYAGLRELSEEVTLIHRRDGFRGHDSSVNTLMQSSVELLIVYDLRELQGASHLERDVIFNNQNQEERSLDIYAVVLALGCIADMGPMRTWGLTPIGRRYIRVNRLKETNLPGVYAAGDVALQENLDRLNLIIVGNSQVTVTANYAYTKNRGKRFSRSLK